MHQSIINLNNIQSSIKSNQEQTNNKNNIKIIAVSKTFEISHINPLIEYGHTDFGENKVQEAVEKWTEIKKANSKIKLHMIGKLQTNKVKFAVKLFDYIHSVDSEKLAKKIVDEQNKINKKIKIFLQVNIGNEDQKSGINTNQVSQLASYCKEIGLDLIGLMCIPPVDEEASLHFALLKNISENCGLRYLSMGMSADFEKAISFGATHIRVGSAIFGERVNSPEQ